MDWKKLFRRKPKYSVADMEASFKDKLQKLDVPYKIFEYQYVHRPNIFTPVFARMIRKDGIVEFWLGYTKGVDWETMAAFISNAAAHCKNLTEGIYTPDQALTGDHLSNVMAGYIVDGYQEFFKARIQIQAEGRESLSTYHYFLLDKFIKQVNRAVNQMPNKRGNALPVFNFIEKQMRAVVLDEPSGLQYMDALTRSLAASFESLHRENLEWEDKTRVLYTLASSIEGHLDLPESHVSGELVFNQAPLAAADGLKSEGFLSGAALEAARSYEASFLKGLA